ncbi:hypothetical protein [Devriesea agamarum]|uniref:hypothetical protein n=1 Tax=Devriesea agamarum TaxID=472569 RepID=UPI00071DEA21|nr:hypothetical protein [Devriesea agamarum]
MNGYESLALRDIPVPDYCDVLIVPTRGVAVSDPQVWAEAMFAPENVPLVRRGARAVRNELLRVVDLVPPLPKSAVVAETTDDEALIIQDDRDLMLRIAVGIEPDGRLLRVTTAVKYKTLRGRMIFAMRRITHAQTTNTLARRAGVTVRHRARIQARDTRQLDGKSVPPALPSPDQRVLPQATRDTDS